jgi:acyl dehydratase
MIGFFTGNDHEASQGTIMHGAHPWRTLHPASRMSIGGATMPTGWRAFECLFDCAKAKFTTMVAVGYAAFLVHPTADAWSSSMSMIYFEDLSVGDAWTSSACTVDHDEMLTYGRTNDPWPFHADPEAAARSPFGGLIASGGYTISLMYRLSHEIVNRPDRMWAFLGGFDWHVKFLEPVRSGDRLHERITILEKRLSSKPGRGIVKHLIEVINDRERVVLSIESTTMMATTPAT